MSSYVARVRATVHRHPLSRTILPACALGCFLVWLDIAFRTSAGDFGSAPSLLPQRSDLDWLVVLGAAALCAFARAVFGALRNAKPSARNAPSSSSDGNDPSALAQATRSQARIAIIAGSLAVGLGTLGHALASGAEATSLACAAVAGLGLPASVGGWLRAIEGIDNEELALILTEGMAISVVVMSAILLLSGSAGLVAVGCLPFVAGVFSLFSASRQSSETEACSRRPSTPQSPLRLRAIVILMSSFIVFFLLGTIGAPATATMRSQAFWLYDIAAVGEIVVFVLAIVALGPSRFHVAVTAILATSVAVTPFLYLANFPAACIVFLKLTTLCTYALALMFLADLQHLTSNQSDDQPEHRLRDGFAYLMMFGIAALMLVGLVAGGALREIEAFTGTVFALLGIALLYVVLLVALAAFARGHRVQVQHVITGRFDTEADIARAQTEALSTLYPALSAREREVLELLLQHYSTKRIADELFVSENTIKTHVRHIYAKIDVNSKQQLLALAQRTAPLNTPRS